MPYHYATFSYRSFHLTKALVELEFNSIDIVSKYDSTEPPRLQKLTIKYIFMYKYNVFAVP